MQLIKYSTRFFTMAAMLTITAATGCKKILEIDAPIGSITTPQVFSTNDQAESAVIGIYTKLINGVNPNMSNGEQGFAMGGISLFCGLSSDEYAFTRTPQVSIYKLYTNKLTKEENSSVSGVLWNSAYDCIYGCNAVMEGISASQSKALTQSMRKQLNGEVRFLRAFAYFYLVNVFGDVPIALTTDFNETRMLKRSPVDQVYKLILDDLDQAVDQLPDAYPSKSGKRIRANKAVAKSFLARVSLFRKDYAKALLMANDVIGQTGKYWLETDLNNVFTQQSNEAIWQLEHSTLASPRFSATPEGGILLPGEITSVGVAYVLSSQLLGAFESGDQRRVKWVVENNFEPATPLQVPYKYKKGLAGEGAGSPDEFSAPIRLSELLLIRAEALMSGSTPDKNAALADINAIRRRAGLTADLPNTLSNEQVIQAIAHERQVELFGEWGHRWFDLKRTGKAESVLSLIPVKQPWAGSYQLLYPIPAEEITRNPNLEQNPKY